MNREYLADERPTIATLGAALEGSFALGHVSRSTRELTFYDTFDGLLYRGGTELVVADGEEIPADARAAAGRRALLPLARVRVRTDTVALLDELDKTVVRVELINPAGLNPRIVLHGLRGYESELEQAIDLLGLPEAPHSLRDEAIRAAGGRPEGISAKLEVPLEGDSAADAATAQVLSALWEVIAANLPGTIDDVDTEFLHDYRVSIRRTRSVLKQLAGVFAPAELEHWRGEFRWLQQVTGDTRDLDVYLEDFDALAAMVAVADRAALGPLRTTLEHRRAAARRIMVRELRSERAHALARGWAGFIAGLTSLSSADRPAALRSIDSVASERIAKVYARMVKQGNAIDLDSPAEDYHDLRKLGKELRYLLELFGQPLHDAEVVKPMVKALKDLQDVLGRHQDREVQADAVRGMADQVAGLPGGPAALIAIGALVRALGADERAARTEFAEAFAAFSSDQQRKLVKKTFG